MSISLNIGQRVEVTGKNVVGEVAFIGFTAFATGKWVGLILDEPKGKNNGSVQGKSYFQCKENHGMFVRQSQLSLITDTGSRIDLSTSTSSLDETPGRPSPASSVASLKPRLTSSRLSLSGRSSKESRSSREDMSASTSSLSEPPTQPKRASFIERAPSSLKRPSTTPTRPIKSLLPTSTTKQQKDSITPEKSTKLSEDDQTGFVETLKPQFTPGQVVSPAGAPGSTSSSGGTSLTPARLQLEPSPELEALRDQIKEKEEKLETIRIKYKEKCHELDTLKLQLDQSGEFKSKIMEAQAALKRELERAKRERQEALEAKEELQDLADTLEMATLDKEMAEEKAESLQRDLDQAKERIEELEMELEITRAELSDKMEAAGVTVEEGEATPFKMKQLLQQNEKLKETLVRLRDLSAHEKHEKQRLMKDLEEKQTDFDQLLKCSEKLKSRLAEMEGQIDELHANVDAALGAEEMVETLGQQKLSLEEKVKELEEIVLELEELQEVNDQLQEGFREQEQDFRQELDSKNIQIWEAQRKIEQLLESLADRELTIVKFRELVNKIQEENQELRLQADSSSKASPMPSEIYDFKKMFAETKAHARAIDLELRHMEVHQAQQHVSYLITFMPDSFLARGGDNDAVMLVLLMPRLLAKCQVLISQLRDKFPPVSKIERSSVTLAQQFSAMSRFSTHIYMLMASLHQFVHGLNTCKPETLLKAGQFHPDMLQQEKNLDNYIELLKQDKLDENVNTESLEKIVTYFSTVHHNLLIQTGESWIHQGLQLADLGKAILCVIDSINTDASIILALVQESEGLKGLKQVESWFEVLRSGLRGVRRHAETEELFLSSGSDLSPLTSPLVSLARVLAETANGLTLLLTSDTEGPLPEEKFHELFRQAFDKHVDSDKYKPDLSYVEQSTEAIANHLTNLGKALLDNEDKYLAQQKDKVPEYLITLLNKFKLLTDRKNENEPIVPPISLRAKAVKFKLNSMSSMEKVLEKNTEDMRALRLLVRTKQDELEEMSIRRELAEKKLANSSKEYELTIETLKRKLEESHHQLKRKEKEFEETMDHLQKDIDSLEMEKGELKDKLKNLPKKAVMDMNMRSSMTSSMLSSDLSSPNVKVVESQFLLNEIAFLRSELKLEKRLRTKAQAQRYLDILKKLPPIHVRSKPKQEDLNDLKKIEELKKKCLDFQLEYVSNLPKVVDLTKIKPGTNRKEFAEKFLLEQELRERQLMEKLKNLQEEVASEVIRMRRGAHVKTDLAVFPSPQMVRASKEPEFVHMCDIKMKTIDPELMGKHITLNVDMVTYELIQKKLMSINNPRFT